MAIANNVKAIRSIITRMESVAGRPSRFGYTEQAFEDNTIEGVAAYDVSQEQNIPLESATQYNPTVINKGLQAEGASIPREAQNHFYGRLSYNIRKLTQQMGKFVDDFLIYAANNAGIYDAAMEYPIGAICFTVSMGDGGVQKYTWYKRTGGAQEVISNIPPDNSNYWSRMSDATMLAQPLTQLTDLNNLLADGVYFTPSAAVGSTISHLPLAVAELAYPVYLVTVTGDSEMVKVQTLMVATQGMAGTEYTRVLNNNGAVIQDWYMSKSPDGMSVTGVPDGLFAFKIEDKKELNPETGIWEVVDTGHLMLYFDSPHNMDSDAPTISIVEDTSDPLYGHLIWEYADDGE